LKRTQQQLINHRFKLICLCVGACRCYSNGISTTTTNTTKSFDSCSQPLATSALSLSLLQK